MTNEELLAEKDRQILALVKLLSELSADVGRAEGALLVSSMPGILEGWMKRAHSAEFLLETVLKENREQADRIEELERDAENVSAEFEGDCWNALRGILIYLSYDWSHGESVTAQDAYDWIIDEIATRKGTTAAYREAIRDNERAWSHAVQKIKDGYVLSIIERVRKTNQRYVPEGE